MRKLAIGILAAGTLMAAAPAMAQVYFDGPGVDVRVGSDRWDRGHHYGWDRNHHRGWGSYAYERGCRTVTVRERTPDGRTIVRTRERC